MTVFKDMELPQPTMKNQQVVPALHAPRPSVGFDRVLCDREIVINPDGSEIGIGEDLTNRVEELCTLKQKNSGLLHSRM